jgi:transcriptional regulator with XRE-family HTH domain
VDNNRPLALAQLVRTRREELGLSYRGLDRLSGVAYSTIANIESGKTRRPDDRILNGLAVGLDLPVSRLRQAVDVPTGQPDFRLPAKAKNLSAKQRKAVLALIEALLEERET